jgi:hypothetical protein
LYESAAPRSHYFTRKLIVTALPALPAALCGVITSW